jgi:hypothetical protein
MAAMAERSALGITVSQFRESCEHDIVKGCRILCENTNDGDFLMTRLCQNTCPGLAADECRHQEQMGVLQSILAALQEMRRAG